MIGIKGMSGWFVLVGVGLASCGSLSEHAGTIAFESYRDGEAEVYLMDFDGENLRNVTNEAAYDGTPSWSPDGEYLAITSERGGNPDIYIIDMNGEIIEQITDGGGFSVVPEWSPDGTKILFSSNRTYRKAIQGGEVEIPDNMKLWVHDIETGEQTRLTGGLGIDMYGSWSPDEESIVFMTVRDENPEIYRLDPARSEFNITNNDARDLNPSWSPDGSKVAFMSNRDGNMEIYILDLGGDGGLINITNHEANDGDPSWSPDGEKLVFTSDRDGNIEIYVMNADGSGVGRLTNDPADDFHPRWQP